MFEYVGRDQRVQRVRLDVVRPVISRHKLDILQLKLPNELLRDLRPQVCRLNLPAIDNTPYFTAVDKTSDIDLTIAAHLAELSVDEFKALNPQFKRPVITGDEQTKILLPKENADKFHLNLAQWGRALSSWTTHKITSARERIETLASRFHTTPEVIRQANNIPSKSVLKAGSTILVPKTASSLP